jgi:hypothetical protein
VIYLVSVQVDHLVLLLVPFLLDENSFSVLRVLAYEAFCFDASLSQIFLSPLFPLFLYFYIYVCIWVLCPSWRLGRFLLLASEEIPLCLAGSTSCRCLRYVDHGYLGEFAEILMLCC